MAISGETFIYQVVAVLAEPPAWPGNAAMPRKGSLKFLSRRQPPNTSIERTVSRGLRQLPTAAHVKR
jgi:hypothetical protein